MAVDTADTNGKCSVFYWDFENDGTYNDTSHNPIYGVPLKLEHEVAVWCKDDDSIQSEKLIFYVYPDDPPPAPTFFTYSTDGDSTVLKWERKLDVHDGTETKAQIAYCFGAGCTPSDSLYASGSEPTLAGIESKWGTEDIGGGVILDIIKTDLPQSGPGRWRVILIDARGSRTPAPAMSGDPATFVAP